MSVHHEVREALAELSYRISGHAADRMVSERLEEIWVIEATLGGMSLEEFPATFPHSSCLILGNGAGGGRVHALWGYDAASGYALLLTVYRAGRA